MEKEITVNGVKLHYSEQGNGNNQTVTRWTN